MAETEAHLIETAMARVVMACALKHHTRRGERDPERWQMASQLVTHALIRDAGFTLPPDAEAWDDLSVEQAYDRLPDPDDGASGDDDSGDDGDASASTGGTGASADAQSSPDSDDDDTGDPSGSSDGGDADDQDTNGGDPDQREGDGQSQDGNGQGEDAASDAPPSHDPSGTGEVMDAGTRAGEDGDAAETPVDVAAEEQAWGRGDAPGSQHRPRRGQGAGLRRGNGEGRPCEQARLAHAAAPLHDRRGEERLFLGACPTGAFIDSGLYLPSIRSEGMETIAVIIDTSGSLPAATLAEFWAELREVAAEIRPESVVVLQVDAVVQDTAEYAPDDLPDEIALKGRGGTDFRPGFEWLDEQGIRPAVCLYFTDMECSRYPETEPSFPPSG